MIASLSFTLRFLTYLFVAICSCGAQTAGPLIWTPADFATSRAPAWEIWGKPAVVAEDGARVARFDGKADAFIAPVIPVARWKTFTVEILFSPDESGPPEQRFLHLQDDQGRRMLIELRLLPDRTWCLDTFLYADTARRLTLIDRTKSHACGRWHWAAITYADGHMAHFVNGVKECEGAIQFEPMSPVGRTSVGVRQNRVSWFKGAIRELRFSPEALPEEKLQRAP